MGAAYAIAYFIATLLTLPPPALPPSPAPVPVVVAATTHPSAETVWDRLADCETGGWVDGGTSFVPWSADWSQEPTSSSPFYGGLQFTESTWRSYGGVTFAPDAAHATRDEQITIAKRVYSSQGAGAWPVCSRKINMR